MSTVASASSPPHPLGPSHEPGDSAMAAAQPPSPICLLNQAVNTADLTGKPDPGREWSEIPCKSRRAYGCGDNIQEAVRGLVLYARLGDGPHLNSSLAIRMTEGARRRFESELDPDYYRRRDAELPSDLIARARVEVAEEHGVTVIILSFTRPAFLDEQPGLLYYLVYDSIGRSLSMFQIHPHPHTCKGVYERVCTLRPIVPKRTDGGDDYKLFLLGQDHHHPEGDHLWVCSLSPSDGAGVPAKFMSMLFPTGQIHKPFKVDVAFSCQGKAFWGDLRQGLLYCDLQTHYYNFVKLPREYKADVESRDESSFPARSTRTMGRVGDSIWFVCTGMPSHYTDAVICIWELVLPEEQVKGKGTVKATGEGAEWKEVEEVRAKVLWKLSSFKKAGLPRAPFRYPILTPDGALCFVLFDQSPFPKQPPLVDYFCTFDILHKRLLWHGLVYNYYIAGSLVMYPSSLFLDKRQCSLQRSSAEDCHTEGLEAMTASKLLLWVNGQGA